MQENCISLNIVKEPKSMKRYLVFLLLVLLVVSSIGVSAVLAGSINFTGNTSSGATMLVAIISTPNCTGAYGSVNVHYVAYNFTVDADGMYTFTEPGASTAIYLYAGGFNPGAAADNCIAASNTNPISLPVALTAGASYTVVVFDDAFAQPGQPYSLTISGPGNILIGDQTDCTYPLPAGSVVYSVPAGAPTFYEADLGTKLNFDLPAGTWWISEFTGDFAKVWIACQGSPVYIPANAVAH
jgi:hypothetical protein